jgi:hypothetical protein
MFTDLYDAISMLWSWQWPVADGRITEVLGEHIEYRSNEKRARLAGAYEFCVGSDGPYTGERFWTPVFCSVRRVAAARRRLRAHRKVQVRYRPDDPSVNRLKGGVAKLFKRAD